MQQQLAEILASLDAAQSRLRRLTDHLSDEAWTRHPKPGAWSAAECVEHLNITSRAFLPLLRDAFAEARLMRGEPSTHYRRDALGWFLSMMIGPLRHVGKFRLGKVKTMAGFVPKGRATRTEMLSEFVRLQADLVSLINTGDGLPLDRVKIVSPFGGKVKYNAYSALVILPRHQHRHLQQAEEAV